MYMLGNAVSGNPFDLDKAGHDGERDTAELVFGAAACVVQKGPLKCQLLGMAGYGHKCRPARLESRLDGSGTVG